MPSKIFDVNTQLAFYGAYHSNKINVMIHMVFVPVLIWTFQVMASSLAVPSFIPEVHYTLNNYLRFDLNFAAIHAGLYIAYYFILEPTAALLYMPQAIISLLTATAYSKGSGHITNAAILHAGSWVAQFLGHGLAEGRAPALFDNLIGATVLAPFFVHLEIMFMLGYKPEMHKRLVNDVGKEIAKIRKAQGDKRRAAAAKSS
ncbi:hypothetical protein H0H81_003908 [Sphagnurus paluster]|uniref:DUF962-domain-containing protein n=1 Tax=Sphagnurus paluster TaxID=117069 RepID=A0A9P7FYW7_9AGAR|nr:hypothetical protein H0H81_003908 [Sphagnurus paluster]